MISLADTGFVIAVALSTELQHQKCVAIYKKHDTIYLPQSTLAEVCYLITREGGNAATANFLRSLPKMKYQLIALT